MEHDTIKFPGTVNGWSYEAVYHLFRERCSSVYLASVRVTNLETGESFESAMQHCWWQFDERWKENLNSRFFYDGAEDLCIHDWPLSDDEINRRVERLEARRNAMVEINRAVKQQIATDFSDDLLTWKR